MNLIDGYVKEVLSESIIKNSDLWEIGEDEKDKVTYVYEVIAEDEGGEFIKELWFDEPMKIEKGYKFLY